MYVLMLSKMHNFWIPASFQEREERKKRLKRERSDDKPVHASQSPGYDHLFHTKILKTYDKSKLPPGKDIFTWSTCGFASGD